MRIVGTDTGTSDAWHVHTIDMWYSQRRRAWIVERLNADGDQVGAAFVCGSEHEAAGCLEDWLRLHDEAYLVAPRELTSAERRVLSEAAQAQAA